VHLAALVVSANSSATKRIAGDAAREVSVERVVVDESRITEDDGPRDREDPRHDRALSWHGTSSWTRRESILSHHLR